METGKRKEYISTSILHIDIYHPLPLPNSKNVCVPVFSHNHYHCDCSAAAITWTLLEAAALNSCICCVFAVEPASN